MDIKLSHSLYARAFDSSNPNWHPNPEYTLLFLRAQENYFNDALHTRGHVFLNEVYDALYIQRTSEGAVVGWILDGEGSDNYISFSMTPEQDNSFLLDFNVDGIIYDKI